MYRVPAAPRRRERAFAPLQLGDARLDRRARTLMEQLAANPTVGVSQAFRGWGRR
ncbi:IS4/Tn5 family transposase DNA-binding protein [Trinickia sp.]|uniref:IS4/Tn5 family transposase DNA-binding protein n=1 Tax=Trinickia sp. TaxID=2571163 RepID=UPI003F7EA277